MKTAYLAALAFALIPPLSSPGSAQEAEPFFAGKTITLVVPSGAGGGYDTYARTLGRHFPKHIPGHPAIVVQNVPGGGGMVAANNLFNVAPKDGTAIAMLASSSFLVAALGERLAKFDNLKFTPIGNMSEEFDTCSVWRTSGIYNANDFLTKEVIIGSEGIGSNSQTFPMGMNEELGAKLKIIPGYGGTQARATAMERGELQGACGIFVSTLASLFERQLGDGTLRVVLQMGLSRSPKYPDVPNALELAPDENSKAALGLMFAQLALGRPIMAPPGLPSERADVLSKAFAETMADPEFLVDAERMKIDTRWFGPARMTEVMQQMEAAPEPVKARVRKMLNIAQP
ncbi:MAG: tripartite tricarboxylate transporter family receptor [Hyphomicrobiales bacterium]|nr:tripartite tricarboxylate transporter family receptor [Hyphomicrobiales bacterium]